MALNTAEQENLAAVRGWWDESGKWLAAALAAAALAWAGWSLWRSDRDAGAEAASDLYEEILELAAAEPGAAADAEDGARVIALAERLRAERPGSVYARYGALFSAARRVEAGDLAGAEADLRWVLDNPGGGLLRGPDEGLVLAATLRLGRVMLARGEPERALSLIGPVDPQTFEAGYAELRGDIFLAMDRRVDARDAYLAARDAGSASGALRLKLDSLAVPQ